MKNPKADDLTIFSKRLSESNLIAALRFLNDRTPHRFTAVYRFDQDVLRNVAMIDKWETQVEQGADVLMADAYCAHLRATGEPLQVADGPSDPRVPWMSGSSIVSYCGAVISDDQGERWGALCHFDSETCESKESDMPLLVAAASLIYRSASPEAAPSTNL
ncbi:MAG: GAF domain-containing protein [Burkholderiales bacterium]|nr:MAG: GAF domain-containing protein [Burkholderiales bacterium]